MKCNVKKISIILCLIMSVLMFSCACSTDTAQESNGMSEDNVIENEAEVPETIVEEPEYIELENADELYNSDEFIGKKIKVKGSVNYSDASILDMKMYCEESANEVYLMGSENYEMPDSYCAIVVGVAEKDEYGGIIIAVESLDPCMDETCTHNNVPEAVPDYEPTIEELKSYCNEVSWEDLCRTPDWYVGNYVKMVGIVADPGDTSLLVATRVENLNMYEDYIWVEYDSSDNYVRFLEADRVVIYGIANGLKSYTTAAGGTNTVPYIQAISVEFAN